MTPGDLALWRKHHHVSQQQLADTLGVQRHTVARWETEERRMPGRWFHVVLRALEKHPELWVCSRCGREGLEEMSQSAKFQGARQTIYHFACPACGALVYTA